MQTIHEAAALQRTVLEARANGKRIGLVPTMGNLHAGHASLIDIARREADLVVVSVFVNPTQFGPNEDYEKYPRTLEGDQKVCEAHGADIVFAPVPSEIYAKDASTFVEENSCSQGLCGRYRPTHFRGVCTVVNLLFNLAQPNVAVFGQKDAQQAAVLKRMVRDLHIPVQIIVAPIVREADGLALSSRNQYLSQREREVAPKIFATLKSIAEKFSRAKVPSIRDYAPQEHNLQIALPMGVEPQDPTPKGVQFIDCPQGQSRMDYAPIYCVPEGNKISVGGSAHFFVSDAVASGPKPSGFGSVPCKEHSDLRGKGPVALRRERGEAAPPTSGATAETLRKELDAKLRESEMLQPQYVEIVDSETMQPLERVVPGHTLVAVAVYTAETHTRLIDNVVI